MIKEFENCFKVSKSAEVITEINWPDELNYLTYRSNSVVVNEEELIHMIKERMMQLNRDTHVSLTFYLFSY